MLGESVHKLLAYSALRAKDAVAPSAPSSSASSPTKAVPASASASASPQHTLEQALGYLLLSRDATKTRWLQHFAAANHHSAGAGARSTTVTARSSTEAAEPALSQPLQLFASLQGALKNLIFDVLFAALRSQLVGLAEFSVWGEQPKALFGGLLAALPSFSQPSEYMTHVGEHLLSLVQQLENYLHAQAEAQRAAEQEASASAALTSAAASASADSKAGAAPEEDASHWLSLLANGVVKFVLDRITHIPKLSEKGAAQLATDLDYLANVLKAVGVPVPAAAEHAIRALQTPPPPANWNAALLASSNWSPPLTDPDHKQLVMTVFGIRKASYATPPPPISSISAASAAAAGGSKLNL